LLNSWQVCLLTFVRWMYWSIQIYASASNAVNSNAITKFDDQICTQSRHDQQWYEKSIAVGDFALNMLLLLLLALATIYHCRYGTSTRLWCWLMTCNCDSHLDPCLHKFCWHFRSRRICLN
jgi:hypothetical protein